MGGDMDHPELVVDQHHRIVLRMGEIGVDLRVSGIMETGQVDGLLADGSGHGGVDLAGQGQVDHLLHVFKGGAARFGGGDLVPDGGRLDVLEIQHIQDAAPVEPLPGGGHRADLEIQSGKPDGLPHHPRLRDGQGSANLIDLRHGQGLRRDFRSDPRRIAHTDSDQWFFHAFPHSFSDLRLPRFPRFVATLLIPACVANCPAFP